MRLPVLRALLGRIGFGTRLRAEGPTRRKKKRICDSEPFSTRNCLAGHRFGSSVLPVSEL
jgi:hypothetical protein